MMVKNIFLIFLTFFVYSSAFCDIDIPKRAYDLYASAINEKNNGNFIEALEILKRAESLYLKYQNIDGVICCNTYIAELYLKNFQDLEKAKDHLNKSLSYSRELPYPSEFVAYTYGILAILHYELVLYDEALEDIKRSNEIFEDLNVPGVFYSFNYDLLGDIYSSKGLYDYATEHYKQSQKFRKDYYGSNLNKYSLLGLINIANQELFTKKYDLAFQHFSEAHDVFIVLAENQSKNIPYELRPLAASIFEGYATINFYHDELPEMALMNYQIALDILYSYYGNYNHSSYVPIFEKIAELKSKNEDHRLAIANYKKCEDILNQTEANLLKKIDNYKNIAAEYTKIKSYDTARIYIEKAIEINNKETKTDIDNSDLDQYYSQEIQVELLQGLAFIIFSRFNVSQNIEELKNAFSFCSAGIKIANQLIGDFWSDDVNEKFLEEKSGIYSLGILCAYHLYESTKEEKYKNAIYQFIEGGNNHIFRRKIQNLWFEDSIDENIEEIREKITTIRDNIAPLGGEKIKNSILIDRTKEIDELYEKYSLELKKLKSQNPELYFLKYGNKLPSIKTIQKKLKRDQSIVEYEMAGENIIIFLINHDETKVHIEEIDENFLDQFFKYWKNIKDIKYDGNFQHSSFYLFEKLLAPIKGKLKKRITIIPHSFISLIPFEALISEKITESESDNFKEYRYLVREYDFNYLYSSGQLVYDKMNDLIEEKKIKYLGVAPDYSNVNEKSCFYKLFKVDKNRNPITPIPLAQKEIITSSQLFLNKKNLLTDSASLGFFTEMAKWPDIIHFGMHSKIDFNDPLNSCLIFDQSKDCPNTPEKNILMVYEIFDLSFNAKLAYINACESGFGKPTNTEGLTTIARAFGYAGIPSLIFSLFRVDDKSGEKIAVEFFKNIKQGKRCSESLRSAKLKYLEDSPAHLCHPYFWAGTIMHGKDISLVKNNNKWIYVFSGIILLLGLSIFILVNKKRSRIRN